MLRMSVKLTRVTRVVLPNTLIRFEFYHNQVSASEEFSGLFSKCFAISTLMLVYTLRRLHNILSSCFPRMGSLWPNKAFTGAGKKSKSKKILFIVGIL